MWSRLDKCAKGLIVVPIVLLGIALTEIAGGLIAIGAWIAGVETDEREW